MPTLTESKPLTPCEKQSPQTERLGLRLPEVLTLIVEGVRIIGNWGADSLVSFAQEGSEVTTGRPPVASCGIDARPACRVSGPISPRTQQLQPLKESELLSHC